MEALHHAYRERDLRHGVTFIEVDPALHHENGPPFQLSDHEPPGVTKHCRDREVRQFAEWNHVGLANGIREAIQSRTQYDPNARPMRGARFDGPYNFVDFVKGKIADHFDAVACRIPGFCSRQHRRWQIRLRKNYIRTPHPIFSRQCYRF